MIICRVCFDNSGNLIPLQSDNIESLPIIHMLKEFTIIVSNSEPKKNVISRTFLFKQQNNVDTCEVATHFKQRWLFK